MRLGLKVYVVAGSVEKEIPGLRVSHGCVPSGRQFARLRLACGACLLMFNLQ
jgi:hypothetical protein